MNSVAGWFFVVSALMLWFGRTFLPYKIGTFFQPGDFAAVRGRFHAWIWMYRLHLFGYIVTVMAFVALAAVFSMASAIVLIWPGVFVASAGLIVLALAHAFYYHFGAWGAQQTEGKQESELQAYVESLQVNTEYVTCWTRFGRVFLGLGMLVLAIGLMAAGAFPLWFTIILAALGIAPMAITMMFPDNLEYYGPVFHINCVWYFLAGIMLIAD
jgi:hypothetical protein